MSLTTAIEDESQGGTSRFHDVRIIGALAGRYALPDRRPGDGSKLPVYACRLCDISTPLLVAVGPVVGKDGETVSSHFSGLGMLGG